MLNDPKSEDAPEEAPKVALPEPNVEKGLNALLPVESSSLLALDPRVAKNPAAADLVEVSSAFSSFSFLAPKVNRAGPSDDSGLVKKFSLVDWASENVSEDEVVDAIDMVEAVEVLLPNLNGLAAGAADATSLLVEEESFADVCCGLKANVESEPKRGLLFEAPESDEDELDLIRAAKVLDDSASLASSLGIS